MKNLSASMVAEVTNSFEVVTLKYNLEEGWNNIERETDRERECEYIQLRVHACTEIFVVKIFS